VAEEPLARATSKRSRPRGEATGKAPVKLADLAVERLARWATGLGEFDYVLGGGVVPGSLILVGGEPGIGKSTLLLQCAARLQGRGIPTLYASGEEAPQQIKLRADRLGEDCGNVMLLGEVRLEEIVAQASLTGAKALVVDSIQTTYTEELEGAPGNVGQVRECAARLMRFAKDSSTAVFLVGHVTRGGVIAGPKTLEHIVDTVLYFEGASSSDYRILRAVKNRFGSVDEVGVFEMTGRGLIPVENPSAAFLSSRDSSAPGSAVTALMEGTRPLLVEIQALAARTGFGTPQRVATGLDHRRLAVLLAVLEQRAGLKFHDQDVFVNVTGGVRLAEPAADLAVVAALCSTLYDRPVAADTVFLGEVGLGGEVRPIVALERRLAEAERLGFRRAFISSRNRPAAQLEVVPIAHVAELARRLAA
jgi:DNA repair protein RadA/Sms